MNNINTPYDDVFRTLLNDCSELIIPVINEIFHEEYTGKEKVEFSQNELFFQQLDGTEEERITDSSFVIIGAGNRKKRYHIECQSTPDKLTIRMKTPGGNLTYKVPILKVKQYSIEVIFEKKLLFLIPFYIFCYEAELKKIAENGRKLAALKEEYKSIREHLDELCEKGFLEEYTKQAIIIMTENVVNSLARKYEAIREGVMDCMGGKILEYEAKDILNRGRQEGRTAGRLESIEQVMKSLSVDLPEACRILGITLEEYEKAKTLN